MTLKMPSSSAVTGAAVSRDTSVSAAPNTMEKNMMPIMSGVERAIDSRGLAGTRVRTNDMSGDSFVGAGAATCFEASAYCAISKSRVSASSRMPGRTVLASRMPRPTETIEMTRQKPTVRTPTRPRRRTSPIPATPTTSDETTSGTTVIKSERRNSWPIGSATCLMTHASAGASGPSTARAALPSVAPTASPSRMRTCSGIRRPVSALSSVCSSRSETTSRSNRSMWSRRFYSADGRNNMSAKHGRHQRAPQPESAGSANGSARWTAHERSASSLDLPAAAERLKKCRV